MYTRVRSHAAHPEPTDQAPRTTIGHDGCSADLRHIHVYTLASRDLGFRSTQSDCLCYELVNRNFRVGTSKISPSCTWRNAALQARTCFALHFGAFPRARGLAVDGAVGVGVILLVSLRNLDIEFESFLAPDLHRLPHASTYQVVAIRGPTFAHLPSPM